MSTIPITFSDMLPSYTVVGGTERGASTGLSAVVLGRGVGRYSRRTLFQDLVKVGFDYIISMEGPQERYDLEELSGRFPQIRFVLLKEEVTLGEQINLAALELSSSLFFVLWNDLKIQYSGGASRMAERLLLSQEEWERQKSMYRRLCTVPLIQNSRFETLPTISAPAVYKNSVKTVPFKPTSENELSLYPFDGVGIYDRARFMRLGGFDGTLKNTYWQLMDFGFRAYLWGEQIGGTQMIRLSYDGETPPEDNSADESYRRFYLKNLAPVFRGDCAYVPLRCFPAYFWRTGKGFLNAWDDFSKGRQWVYLNRFRFKSDSRAITELWNREEEHPISELQAVDLPKSAPLTEDTEIPPAELSPSEKPPEVNEIDPGGIKIAEVETSTKTGGVGETVMENHVVEQPAEESEESIEQVEHTVEHSVENDNARHSEP